MQPFGDLVECGPAGGVRRAPLPAERRIVGLQPGQQQHRAPDRLRDDLGMWRLPQRRQRGPDGVEVALRGGDLGREPARRKSLAEQRVLLRWRVTPGDLEVLACRGHVSASYGEETGQAVHRHRSLAGQGHADRVVEDALGLVPLAERDQRLGQALGQPCRPFPGDLRSADVAHGSPGGLDRSGVPALAPQVPGQTAPQHRRPVRSGVPGQPDSVLQGLDRVIEPSQVGLAPRERVERGQLGLQVASFARRRGGSLAQLDRRRRVVVGEVVGAHHQGWRQPRVVRVRAAKSLDRVGQ